MNKLKLPSLEYFSGAGGLSLGLHRAGFQHESLIEWDENSTNTLKLNATKLLGISPDLVLNIDARNFECSKYNGKIDLLAGGPPCQPFSNSGKNLGHLDSRDMFPVFLDAVRQIKPKAVMIENVRGLLRTKFSDYFAYILLRLQYPDAPLPSEDFRTNLSLLQKLTEDDYPPEQRYNVKHQLVDTANYGIPQRRERVIFVAFRADLGIIPEEIPKTHCKLALLEDQYITGNYWKRHNIKPTNQLGPNNLKLLEKLKRENQNSPNGKKLLPWKTVRDAISDLPRPVERGAIPCVPNHIQHPGAREYAGHIGSYYDLPAKALKAGTHGTPGGENMLRIGGKEHVRYFTTREAGRLHTFPDEWEFSGVMGACFRQLGNAVPVELAEIFGKYIYERLQGIKSDAKQ